MNEIYGYDNNIYKTSIGNISNSGLRIYEGNVSTSTGKVVVNGVEVTDIESWNKALDTFANLEQKIEEKDKQLDKYKNVIDKIKEIVNNNAFFDPAMPNCMALGQKSTLEIKELLEEVE